MKIWLLFFLFSITNSLTTIAQKDNKIVLDRQIRVYDSLKKLLGKGKLVSINEHALMIEKDDEIDTIEMKNIAYVKIGRSARKIVRNAALIGTGAGVVTAAAHYPNEKRESRDGYAPDLSGLIFLIAPLRGALFGAIVGGVLSVLTPVKTFFIYGKPEKWNLLMEYVKEPDNPKFQDSRKF